MLPIFIDIRIVHIQTSNTVLQWINLFIMAPYTLYHGQYILRVEYSVEK